MRYPDSNKKPFSRVDRCRDEGEFHLSKWRASACLMSMSETSNSSLIPCCNSSVLVFRPWGNLVIILFDHWPRQSLRHGYVEIRLSFVPLLHVSPYFFCRGLHFPFSYKHSLLSSRCDWIFPSHY